MRMMRCKSELRISLTGSPIALDLWPGVEVDFDRELAPEHTIAQLVHGREDCFEPVSPEIVDPVSEPVAPEQDQPWAEEINQ